ncbi:MarR family winged helix-turn-helix transcriptional regulator [Streptomyces sp. NPDC053499]|uniref:MarR family winged helix-turn-helix transcriptional regulator n=1 Tax=Streptomyces sp. NPDC053499 TaxID=3365707 RepID=UPI0037D4290A
MPETPHAPTLIRTLPSWLLGRAAARGRALVAEALAEEGLRMWHHVVLAAASDHQPVAQAELARSVALDPKDVVGILNELEKDGYVRREPHPQDRRKNAVRLTPEGASLLARCADAAQRANDLLLEGFTARERADFLALLERAARL